MNITYIIPHFENVEGLERLLPSIALFDQDKIIIVDDNSCENTKNSLKKLQERHSFELILSEENLGAGNCRNRGLQLVETEFVIFSDSDDFFTQEYKEITSKNNREKYVSYDVIYFKSFSTFETENTSISKSRDFFYNSLIDSYLEKPTDINKNNLLYKFVVPWAKIYRTNFLVENNIKFQEVKVANDVYFSTLVGYYAKNILVENKVLYNCVERSNSMTADTSISKTLSRIDVFSNQVEFLKNNLSKNDFKNLQLTGGSFVLLGLRSKYNFSDIIKIIVKLKENNIKLLTFNKLHSFIINKMKF